MFARAFLLLTLTLGTNACARSRLLESDGGTRGDASRLVDASLPMDAALHDAASHRRDGSVLPALDAGNPFGDAGPLGIPSWRELEVRVSDDCDPFTACGGDEIGTWDVSGGCVSVPFSTLTSACPSALVTYRTGQARGRVSLDGNLSQRVAQSIVEIGVFVPAACAALVGGCGGVADAIATITADSACLPNDDGSCDCAARDVTNIDLTDTYSIVDEREILTNGGRHYLYCVMGDSFAFKDTTPGYITNGEPSTITSERR